MLKKTLFVASAAIALAATLSLPALAIVDNEDDFTPDVVTVPEPMTVFGLIAFAGGGLLAKKRADSQKAE
ncbi:PEP-CTERM sorting domain-containing protein [Okeanomitos corallinicola TIOX110]|uniref:PEP-CTERM sorting domain-containing protein n=1 Tax=Okeanomitos corallinicola TIOX110 TaxID=3133117 RepID=A0ABZ2USL9_9CYAN